MLFPLMKRIHYHYSTQRPMTSMFHTFFDHKRNFIFTIFLLFTIPLFYVVSNSSVQNSKNDALDICSDLIRVLSNSNRTLCSSDADRRGNRQRVISLTIFGPKENPMFVDSKFSHLIFSLIDEAENFFPQWTIRLYSDDLTINRLNLKNLSNFSTKIDVCNVNRLPILGDVGEFLAGKLWRFLPVLDPMVDFTSSRDLDSPLTEREQIVVEKFVNSSFLFLSLRDHPLHGIPILGGLWTAAQYRNRLLFYRLFSVLLDRIKVQRYTLSNDQTFLSEIVWPKVKDQTLAFDSFTCGDFKHYGTQRPFPTQRPSVDCHLGCVRPCCQNSSRVILPKQCPKECRPVNHFDWIYC